MVWSPASALFGHRSEGGIVTAIDRTPDPAPELTAHDAGLAFLTGETFTDEARFHAGAALLRRESPVHWVEHPDFNPFYVLTKHADVLDVELHPDIFLNAPRAIMGTKVADENRAMQGHLVKSLVQMDDPEHRLHRQLTADWFLPKNLGRLQVRLDQLAERAVQQMIDHGGECDFARDIAMQYPLYVILAILGLPEDDYPRMLQLTQELFGAEDPDFKRDDDALASLIQTVADFVAYFDGITADRQASPPTTSPRSSPTASSRASRSATRSSSATTSSPPRPGTTPPPTPCRAACTPSSSGPTSWPACRPTRRCSPPPSTR
jgi:cytochrome P450